MKRSLFILLSIIFTAVITAQIPESFKYQTVVRDSDGKIISNHAVSFRMSILQGSSTGTVVYSETFNTTTNQFGLVNLNLGQGTPVSGNFSTINWSTGLYWLKVEIDPAGGTSYSEAGTSQLLSVPYALYSKNSATSYWNKNGSNIYFNSGNVGIGITNPEVKLHVNGGMVKVNGAAQYGYPTVVLAETSDSHTDVHESVLTIANYSNNASSQANIKFDAGNPGHGRAIISATHDQSAGMYNGNLFFKVRNGEVSYNNAITIRSSGNVGINETNPDSKLHVNGNVHITGNVTMDSKVSIPTAPVDNTDAVNKAYVDQLKADVDQLKTDVNQLNNELKELKKLFYQQSGLVLWNKLGSVTEVQNSEVGENGQLVGTAHAFEPAKHGNGYVRKDPDSWVKFPKSVLQNLKTCGTLELWVNPKVTKPVAYQYGAFMIVGYSIDCRNAHVFIRWGDGTTGKGIVGGVNFDGNIIGTPDETNQFEATIGVPFHLAVVWDVNGIDGTNHTVRMYRDGILIGYTVNTWNPNGTADYDFFYLGTGAEDTQGWDKYITDNIKIWNYAKTDFSDRFKE